MKCKMLILNPEETTNLREEDLGSLGGKTSFWPSSTLWFRVMTGPIITGISKRMNLEESKQHSEADVLTG